MKTTALGMVLCLVFITLGSASAEAQAIVGTWLYEYSGEVDWNEYFIFEEDGSYAFWISPVIRGGEAINEPLIPAYLWYGGEYSISSDSLLRQCVDITIQYKVYPPNCDDVSYSIEGGSLILEVGEFGIGHREYDGLEQVTFTRHNPKPIESIVGAWGGRHFTIAYDAVWTFEEDGGYSERVPGYYTEEQVRGTYVGISDSMLQICLRYDHSISVFDDQTGRIFRADSNFSPPVCYNTPYFIMDNSLIIGPARVRFEEGTKYLPEYTLMRQGN